jgi:hypothetical protein
MEIIMTLEGEVDATDLVFAWPAGDGSLRYLSRYPGFTVVVKSLPYPTLLRPQVASP